MKDPRKRLISGSIFRTLHFFLQLAVAFIMTPLVIGNLGEDQYGLWILILAVFGIGSMMDFGLSSGLSRYISRAIGTKDTDDILTHFNTGFLIYCAIGFVALVLSLAGASVCFLLIQQQQLAKLVATVVAVLGLNLTLRFLTLGFRGILTAHLRYDYYSIAASVGLLLANLGIYWLISRGAGIRGIAVVILFSSLVESLLILMFAKITFPELSFSLARFDDAAKKRLLGYGWKTILCQIGNILIYRADPLIISAVLFTSANTFYSIGSRLNEYFKQLVSSLIGNMSPVFSQREGEGDFNAVREIFLHITKVSTFVSVFIGASLIFYGDEFILRWLGPRFIESYDVAAVLAFGYTLTLMQHPSSSLLYGLSKHHYGAALAILQGILNVALSIPLAGYLGLPGVAWGTAIGLSINILLIQPFVICRIVKLPTTRYYGAIASITLKTLVPLGLFFALADRFMTPDYGRILLVGAVQALIFIPLTYYFILDARERKLLSLALTQRKRPPLAMLEM
jgi:O-antigen/teichoic acid export membrane protein